jgi:hypothetical protein
VHRISEPQLRLTEPQIYVVRGLLAQAIDDVVVQLDRLAEFGIYRGGDRLVNARGERCEFSLFADALDRSFEFFEGTIGGDLLHVGRRIDMPQRLARTIFEGPWYWSKLPSVSGIVDRLEFA